MRFLLSRTKDSMGPSRLLVFLIIIIIIVIAEVFYNEFLMRNGFQFPNQATMHQQFITFSPPPTAAISMLEWNNTRPLVHVVLTRFMQFQPDLLYLGNARLELFEMFCLPTMVKQTNANFLWIIRADPDLRVELKNRLLSLVQGIPNVLVVGSNARIDDGHFRHPKSIEDITMDAAHRLWYGNFELLRSYHAAAQSHVVLETGLDADDGLALNYIERLQLYTHQVLVTQKALGTRKWWKLWCVRSCMDWWYYGNTVRLGLSVTQENQSHMCITPGLSRASTPTYRYYKESKDKKKLKGQLNLLKTQGRSYFIDHWYINQFARLLRNATAVGGYSFVPNDHHTRGDSAYKSQALRARTPTSTGMIDIVKSSNAALSSSSSSSSSFPRDNNMTMEDQEPLIWNRLEETFGVSRSDIRACRDRIEAYLPNMLDDSIQGQCRSSGHSCKNTSKNALTKLRKSLSKH